MSTLGDVVDVTEIVVDLLSAGVKLVRAARAGNEAAVDQSLMEAQEAIKKEMDRRKFGRAPNGSDPPPAETEG